MSKIGKLVHRVVDLYKRQDHIKYAKSLGVSVGENSRFVDNPSWGSEPYLITIGKHVLISGRVTFLNHDGATWVFREEGPYKDTYKFGPIAVGDNCFIGFGATILPNVKIGDNSNSRSGKGKYEPIDIVRVSFVEGQKRGSAVIVDGFKFRYVNKRKLVEDVMKYYRYEKKCGVF